MIVLATDQNNCVRTVTAGKNSQYQRKYTSYLSHQPLRIVSSRYIDKL